VVDRQLLDPVSGGEVEQDAAAPRELISLAGKPL
jgi:hypothetical protein